MNIDSLISAIDNEISKLTKVRELLTGTSNGAGRRVVRRPHVLSAEARERIAAAQRKRWAAQKKAAE